MYKNISFIITLNALKTVMRQLLIWLGPTITGGWFVSLPFQYFLLREPPLFYRMMDSESRLTFNGYFIFIVPILCWLCLLWAIDKYQKIQQEQQLPAREIARTIIKDGFNVIKKAVIVIGIIEIFVGGVDLIINISPLFRGQEISLVAMITALFGFFGLLLWFTYCAIFLIFTLASFYFLGWWLENPPPKNQWYLTDNAGQTLACWLNIWPYRHQIKTFWLLIFIMLLLTFMAFILTYKPPIAVYWFILAASLVCLFFIWRSLQLLFNPKMQYAEGKVNKTMEIDLSTKIYSLSQPRIPIKTYTHYVTCNQKKFKVDEDTYNSLSDSYPYRLWFSAWIPTKAVGYEPNPAIFMNILYQQIEPLPQTIALSLTDLPTYLADLNHPDFSKRRHAIQALLSLGGQAIPDLVAMAEDKAGNQQAVAAWLLYKIAQETKQRLAKRSRTLLCPNCFVYCHRHASPTFYGCRACRQSREFLEITGQVIAVLDHQMSIDTISQGANLRVNWLARQSLFDFDTVEIKQASDEQVERFAVQVGNDTDPVRQPRYNKMRCVVSPECGLSENTMRVLGQTFSINQERAKL